MSVSRSADRLDHVADVSWAALIRDRVHKQPSGSTKSGKLGKKEDSGTDWINPRTQGASCKTHGKSEKPF